ncbi:hypothetical protein NEOLEDRAFT_1064978, partial [Neolentinus lepideus HHB14362 ss-1]
GYIDGHIQQPDCATDLVSYNNWISNNESILNLVSLCIAPEEHHFLKGLTTAHGTWEALHTHHEQQGPLAQITLIEKAFSTAYSCEEHSAVTSHCLTKIVECIWAIRISMKDMFLLIAMLNSLHKFPGICNPIATTLAKANTIHPFSSDTICEHLDYEQKILDCEVTAAPTQAPFALAMQSSVGCGRY